MAFVQIILTYETDLVILFVPEVEFTEKEENFLYDYMSGFEAGDDSEEEKVRLALANIFFPHIFGCFDDDTVIVTSLTNIDEIIPKAFIELSTEDVDEGYLVNVKSNILAEPLAIDYLTLAGCACPAPEEFKPPGRIKKILHFHYKER